VTRLDRIPLPPSAFDQLIEEAATRMASTGTRRAVIATESAFDPMAVSARPVRRDSCS
jgi:hypothetical protein